MITDRLENIYKYNSMFSGVCQFSKFLDTKSLMDIKEKETYRDIFIFPVTSDSVSVAFDKSILEAHKNLMDIHITLEGTDVIAYADLDRESIIFKAYDEASDYLLVNSDFIKTIEIPKGYFCIIPSNFAHMALYTGHTQVKKIVVKMPVDL
ncbi:YhcH/YjgK/YiaL family protein [Gillisia marina]|uniref:YhcH/YjgK/YiaL family protein n=1 Tax=Gillisia marina TaxID=1167637 RepID=UPI0004943B1B|nr:YhcH/YjgK/YiaL family protein [Gillisia marina]